MSDGLRLGARWLLVPPFKGVPMPSGAAETQMSGFVHSSASPLVHPSIALSPVRDPDSVWRFPTVFPIALAVENTVGKSCLLGTIEVNQWLISRFIVAYQWILIQNLTFVSF